MSNMQSNRNGMNNDDRTKPYLQPIKGVETALDIKNIDNPLPRSSLGYIGLYTNVDGPSSFARTMLIQPFRPKDLIGINPISIRVFRFDKITRTLKPHWESGINLSQNFVWSKIRKPGVYIPVGLPRDRLLYELLRHLAHKRHYSDTDLEAERNSITKTYLSYFTEAPEEELENFRRVLTVNELHTGSGPFSAYDIKHGGHGWHLESFPLPGNMTLKEFKDYLSQLDTPQDGLPEESLFYKPEAIEYRPWSLNTQHKQHLPLTLPKISQPSHNKNIKDNSPRALTLPPGIQSLESKNWWMYHGDAQHTGRASGSSRITSTSVSTLKPLHPPITLDGPVISIPSVVDGKIYVGTSGKLKLYKIDISSGKVEDFFPKEGEIHEEPRHAYFQGVGGSPAIVNQRIFFTSIPGKVWCLDSSTMKLIWSTDLRKADPEHNQPVENLHFEHEIYGNADCWSSPLVVNGKVYVGCGEGEGAVFGFVYCLDANNGNVIWLFCTNKFSKDTDNKPNVIPKSTYKESLPLPTGFKVQIDPPNKGVSIWSSCAYDKDLNRIFVGTGNTTVVEESADVSVSVGNLVDEPYGSGVLSLDADTGEFKGFFVPEKADNYRPDDDDLDIGASPMLFTNNEGKKILTIGSKNGSFFLIDPDTMKVIKRSQLLPKDENNNLLPEVDGHMTRDGKPFMTENMYGIFSTAAVHESGRLFVGLGGKIYSEATPFMRALDWNTLDDVWKTQVDTIGLGKTKVKRYASSHPPMYVKPWESGMSSPAIVNDIVFMSTTGPGLYAFDIETGKCLWSSPDFVRAPFAYLMGPAVYGDYVVVGTGTVTITQHDEFLPVPENLWYRLGEGQGTIHIYSL
jgi:outer membrane protein assembly factor BamB